MIALQRVPVKRRRTGKPRRGRVVDRKFLAFIASQPCLVTSDLGCHGSKVTVHHVREFGSPKDDRRTVPLCRPHHLHDWGVFSIERLGKNKFEAAHGVDLEGAILKYNAEYEAGATVKHPPDVDLEF